MRYNPLGYRFFSGASNYNGDVFIYSSQGQLVAKYRIAGNTLKLDFLPIYEGSKRIGIVEPEGIEWEYCPGDWFCNLVVIDPCIIMVKGHPKPPCDISVKLRSERKYELTDHLGNVRVVIADQRVPVSTNGNTVAYYKPLVKEILDYYPYGWQKIFGKYQFGANAGSLFEDWDSTKGTYYTLYRLLDARIARWYQVEPKVDSIVNVSLFHFVYGNPLSYVDPLGLDSFILNSKGQIIKRIETDDTIHIFIAEETGAVISIPVNVFIEDPVMEGENRYNPGIMLMGLKSGSQAIRLFKWLARNINVEWGFIRGYKVPSRLTNGGYLSYLYLLGEDAGEEVYYVYTNFNEHRINYGFSKYFMGSHRYIQVAEMGHSHPDVGAALGPSPRDVKNAHYDINWVYDVERDLYIYYNKEGIIGASKLHPNEIEIRQNK